MWKCNERYFICALSGMLSGNKTELRNTRYAYLMYAWNYYWGHNFKYLQLFCRVSLKSAFEKNLDKIRDLLDIDSSHEMGLISDDDTETFPKK